jgi:hypothetical protein
LRILIVLLTFIGCVSQPVKKTLTVKVTQDSVVSVNGEKTRLAKNKTLEVDPEENIIITSPGHFETVLVPIQPGTQQVNVKPKKITLDSLDKEMQEEYGNTISDMMKSILEIQMMIANEKYTVALNEVRMLRNKYPHVYYLLFLEGTCLYLNGMKKQAIRSYELALKYFPNNKVGWATLKRLKGELE